MSIYDLREDESLLMTIDRYISRCRSLVNKYQNTSREKHYRRCILGAEIVRDKVAIRLEYYRTRRPRI